MPYWWVDIFFPEYILAKACLNMDPFHSSEGVNDALGKPNQRSKSFKLAKIIITTVCAYIIGEK